MAIKWQYGCSNIEIAGEVFIFIKSKICHNINEAYSPELRKQIRDVLI